jgi:hypothetical protein
MSRRLSNSRTPDVEITEWLRRPRAPRRRSEAGGERVIEDAESERNPGRCRSAAQVRIEHDVGTRSGLFRGPVHFQIVPEFFPFEGFLGDG